MKRWMIGGGAVESVGTGSGRVAQVGKFFFFDFFFRSRLQWSFSFFLNFFLLYITLLYSGWSGCVRRFRWVDEGRADSLTRSDTCGSEIFWWGVEGGIFFRAERVRRGEAAEGWGGNFWVRLPCAVVVGKVAGDNFVGV